MINEDTGIFSNNTREIILDILMEICEKGGYSHVVLRQTLSKYQYLHKKERSFITKVTETTLENLMRIDYVIDIYSKIKTKKMKPLIRNLLRLSVCQILFLDSVPPAAVCNEAVKLAIKRSFGQLKGFVNGVLRAIIRNKDNIKYPDASEDMVGYLSIYYSVPEWIVEQLIYQYGLEDASRIIKGSAEYDGKVCVRVNTLKTTVDQVVENLKNQGISVCKSSYYKNALYIKDFDYLEDVEAFNDGLISVQDISSMMVSVIADPKEGNLCMDLCAAPGGKSLHLYEIMNGKGRVIARDISEKKVQLIRDNAERTEADGVIPQVYDATVFDEEYENKADIVIADLPCSGLGVIGKKSDIKYNMTKEKELELVKVQRAILTNAMRYVKPGGVLVYSTCTINRGENLDNMNFIKENQDFEPCDISGYITGEVHKKEAEGGYVQMLQGIDDTDGFFICKFRKKTGK